MIRKVVLIIILLSSGLFAQQYSGLASEILLWQQGSAKTEAMGGIQSLNYDPNFLSQSNPAALTFSKGVSVFYSNSSGSIFNPNDTYHFGGVSVNSRKYGAIGINIINLVLKRDEYSSSGMGKTSLKANQKLYTLSYANKVFDWFSAGINFNYYEYTFKDKTFERGSFFDLGLIKEMKLVNQSDVKYDVVVGLQIRNLLNQYANNGGDKSIIINDSTSSGLAYYKFYFPSIAKFGISNTVSFGEKTPKGKHLFAYTLGLEYQDILNFGYMNYIRIGNELSLFDLIMLRFGYYNRVSDSHSSISEFTYGFGAKLDLSKVTRNSFPLVIKVDFTHLPSPIDYYSDINYTTVNMILTYELN